MKTTPKATSSRHSTTSQTSHSNSSKTTSSSRNKPFNQAKPSHGKFATKNKATHARKPSFKMPSHIKIEQTQGLHERNKHHGRYDFEALIKVLPELEAVVILNPRGEESVNFSDPLSVKLLNKALLAHYYAVKHWDLPPGYLCPPIPGRADYIHRVADLLIHDAGDNLDHSKIRMLDIGTGANCIYPIIATSQYGWRSKGSDIDPISIKTANFIVQNNPVLTRKVQVRLQTDNNKIFKGIIGKKDNFDVVVCNPPFHASADEAEQGSLRKINNLHSNKHKRGQGPLRNKPETKSTLNFGGQQAELWCEGGEAKFIGLMAAESKAFAGQVLWFTSLVSKKETLPVLHKQLSQLGAEIKIIEMQQGQKISRLIAWSFLSSIQRQDWFDFEAYSEE